MLITLKTAFDEEFAFYSPSHVMLYLLAQQEFSRQRIQHIEFYTNAKALQAVWATEHRNIEHITLYRSQGIQQMIKCLHRFKATVKERRANEAVDRRVSGSVDKRIGEQIDRRVSNKMDRRKSRQQVK
jgi:RsiW-degrading membrane proteinase PrsW (M82 family)